MPSSTLHAPLRFSSSDASIFEFVFIAVTRIGTCSVNGVQVTVISVASTSCSLVQNLSLMSFWTSCHAVGGFAAAAADDASITIAMKRLHAANRVPLRTARSIGPMHEKLPFCVLGIARACDAAAMGVREEARQRGFTLEERPLRGQWVWGWRRGDDTRWPCYLTEREALSYMADRLRRTAAFE